ncbi:TonB-linked outer membrane protein, SusC/RagA family [Pedobacter sp. ok626]|uniref:SusC/RagA family TonB-linked outer membrane protein n=1 Tax=Pedobacter sp. ok626 TaxID=1761882 RepID=UPI000888D566|nr:TonB-dependent receptor [Pedobacter sp. ok626]SDJ78520.1 TonB-linked outer membrane protein, SusC/RagA family [Pedobacter sp. ok626]
MNSKVYLRGILLIVFSCFLFLKPAFSQTKVTIQGIVKDEQGGILPGASVTVQDTKQGTVTNEKGEFSLTMDAGKNLMINYLGFQPKTYPVTKSETITINLIAQDNTMNTVVVIGYGTQKKSSVTGSVAKLTNDNLNQIPVSRADQALAGKLAGVQIQTTDATAGAAPVIKIRGAASITAGTNPLIVIDGYPVPTDLSAVDMNNVESIEVLKDAASAAIYGSRGANGVILITSKSGKTGKTVVGLNTSAGFKDVYRRLDFPTLSQWADHVKSVNNGNLSPEIIAAQQYDVPLDPQDIVFRQGSFQNAQVNVSGGSNTVKYYVSGEALFDKGVIATNNYKRYGGQANIDITPNKKWKIGISLTPSYTAQQVPNYKIHDLLRSFATWLPLYATESISQATGLPVGNMVHQRAFDPAANTRYKGINLSATANNNGYANLYGIDNKTFTVKTLANANVQYNFSEALSLKVSGGAFISNTRNEFFQKSWATRDPFLQGAAVAQASTRGTLANSQTIDLLNENILSYNKSFNKHDLSVIAGFTAQSTQLTSSNSAATNFATDNIPTLNAGTLSSLSSTEERSALASVLFRANYAYDNKYLVSIGSRWDGSSRFGVDNRWGYFPSASVGWRVNNESFYPENAFVNDLKIRASYGATGNNNIGNYRAYANVNTVGAVLGDATSLGFNSSFYDNPDLGWERSFSFNTGVDMAFLKNRLTLTVDAYRSTTKDLLFFLPINTITGNNGVWTNVGEVQNQGFEIELGAKIIDKENLKWSLSANGATNKNTVKALGNSDFIIGIGDPKRLNYFLAKVGQPLVQFYGYEYDSDIEVGGNFWPTNVHSDRVIARDINNDGVVNEQDRVVLGQPTPKFTWGLTSNLKYKDFDLSFVLQGSEGASVFNADPNYYETQFSATGTSAYLSLPANIQAKTKYKTESRYSIEDASFIALRSLNVGYTLNAKWLSAIKASNLRIYASAANLWYKFAKGYSSYNPEGVNEYTDDPLKNGYQRGSAPVTRNITFGINANF